MGFLKNKRALITGVISNRSIAYGIAEAFQREGAELAFTYQTDKVKERVVDLASEFNSKLVYPCDVSCDEDITNLFKELNKSWDGLDILVHSIAYAPADQLKGDYVECINREGFQIAHDVSSYSLGALAKAAMPMMKDRKGSIVTMSYLGSERAFPSYNVMGIAKASLEANVRYLAYSLGPKGIRVNAISAGPIKTLAAAGIQDFRKIQNAYENIVPMRENITTEQVGNTAAFLCSDLASGITGEVVHVDNGFHIVGLMGEGF